MASRILHLAAAEKIMEQVNIANPNRFRLGILLPDTCGSRSFRAESHLELSLCDGKRKTYELTRFRELFSEEIWKDECCQGYYLHLVQDLIFRRLMHGVYHWNSDIPGNVEGLHRDYHLLNADIIGRYHLKNEIVLPKSLENEKIFSFCQFDLQRLLSDLQQDFAEQAHGEFFFFTPKMADEFVSEAVAVCVKELQAMQKGAFLVNEVDSAWEK